MVLRRAVRVGQPCEIFEQFALHTTKKREKPGADSARRVRHDRSARPKSGVVSRSKALWRQSRTGSLSAGTTWPARREAPARPAQPYPGLVRRAFEVTVGVGVVLLNGRSLWPAKAVASH